MITITAMKWAPPFAQGKVRDHRARWILNEAGWPYRVRLLDYPELKSDAYRDDQPFKQVPAMEEDGRATLFESGAIVLDIATRSGALWPAADDDRAMAVCWLFAALNTIEPRLMSLVEVDLFTKDEAAKRARRPVVLEALEPKLADLVTALGERAWLVGDGFTIADLMMSSVLKSAPDDVLDRYPALARYRARCFERPAYRKAIDDQLADFAEHGPAEMKFPPSAG